MEEYKEGLGEPDADQAGPEQIEYDRERWGTLRNDPNMGAFRIINSGLEMGVPRDELEAFISERTNSELAAGNYGFEFRLRKFLNFNTPDELNVIGQNAYQSAFEAGAFRSAANIAEDLYGQESPQYISAMEREGVKAATEIESKEEVEISINSSMGELITALEEADLYDNFIAELHDSFDKKFVEAFIDLLTDAEKLSTISIEEFFHEYPPEDLEVFLPLKFI